MGQSPHAAQSWACCDRPTGARGLEWGLRGTHNRCLSKKLGRKQMLSPAEKFLSPPKKLHPHNSPPPHTKLRAPHLPSPDGAPCANASSSSRIFQRGLKLLPRRSGAAVLQPSASQSSGWGAAGSGPRSQPLAVRAAGAEGDPRSRRLGGPGFTPAAPAARPCAPAAHRTLRLTSPRTASRARIAETRGPARSLAPP